MRSSSRATALKRFPRGTQPIWISDEAVYQRDRRDQRAARKEREKAKLRKLPVGSCVMVRKLGSPSWRAHTTRTPITARTVRVYGDTRYLQYQGWEIQARIP